MLAAAKQSTLSPEQRQITAFFGGSAQSGVSKTATSKSSAEPIDLDPEPNSTTVMEIDVADEGQREE